MTRDKREERPRRERQGGGQDDKRQKTKTPEEIDKREARQASDKKETRA